MCLHTIPAYVKRLLLALACLAPSLAKAQFFTSDSFCPTGAAVETDTISYLPTAQLPFDRCFYLKYILPDKTPVIHFTVTPIDKYGNTKAKRRDRRVFLRSGWAAGPKRRAARKRNPFDNFRRGTTTRLFIPQQYPLKSGQSALILRVPPLDPGREYKITLFAGDLETANGLLEVADLVFQSQFVAPAAAVTAIAVATANPTPANTAAATAAAALPAGLRNEAALLHGYNVTKRRFSDKERFSSFVNSLYVTRVELSGVPNEQEPYKVFFGPTAAPPLPAPTPPLPSALNALDETHYISVSPSSNPISFEIQPEVNLATGAVIIRKNLLTTPNAFPPGAISTSTTKSKGYYTRNKTTTVINAAAVAPLPNPLPLPTTETTTKPKKYLRRSTVVRTKTIVPAAGPVAVPPTPPAIFLVTPINITVPVSYDIHVLRDTVGEQKRHATYVHTEGTLQFAQNGTLVTAATLATANDGQWMRTTPSVMQNLALLRPRKIQVDVFVADAGHVQFPESALHIAMTLATACPCEEKGVKDLRTKDDLLSALALFTPDQAPQRADVAAGLRPVGDLAQKPVDATNYAARNANVKASIEQLYATADFLRKASLLDATNAPAINTLLSQVNQYRGFLESVTGELEGIIKLRTASTTFLMRRLGLRKELATSNGSTSVLNILSEYKFRIIPDFGFVVLSEGGRVRPQDFSPYLGFNVGLRPIDKHIPLRMIRYKTLRHRLSFNAGITLRSLEIKNERENFISGSNLITGLGFRLTNALQVSAGGVWFKAYSTNPLSDKRPIRAVPYLGLSADLEIQDLFGGIKTFFTKI